MKRFHLIALLSLFCFHSAHAAELYGLSMHGEPRYTAGDTHLTYANPDAPKGGAITQSAIGSFDSLNPYAIKGKPAAGLNLVYDRLMARAWDEPFTMVPLIAKSYDIAADRSWISFTLNPDAKFSDGSPITADDVLFSFETLKTSGRPNMRNVYKLVAAAEKTADNTVKFTFGEGHDRETALILSMMPVLSKKYWEGRAFDSSTLDIPVSSGPYKIAQVDPGRKIVYERDPDYWAKDLLPNVGHNNFDRITYEYYRDDTVAFEAFKAGNVSLRLEPDAGKWASAYDFPAAKSGKVTLDEIKHSRPERTRGMIFNTRRAPFDDVRVREALELMFDFDWINKTLFHGRYKRIESYFPNSELASQAELVRVRDKRQNIRKANALLEEAGWKVVNGKRMKDGKPFEFEILLGAPEDEKIALHFKKSLEQLGITMRPRVLDTAAFRARLNEYDFDMTIYYWISSLSPGTEQILYWGCAAAKEPARWNFPGICDPEIDALAGEIAATADRETLVDTMKKLDKKLLAGHYMIPLYYSETDNYAYWKPLGRPQITPIYGAVLETWYMDAPEQEKTEEKPDGDESAENKQQH